MTKRTYTTHEEQLAALEQELVEFKVASDAFGLERLNCLEANIAMFNEFFAGHNVNFQLKRVSKDSYFGSKDNDLRYDFCFMTDADDSWGSVSVEVLYSSALGLRVHRFGLPSRSHSGKDLNLDKDIAFFQNMTNLANILKSGTELAAVLDQWKEVERTWPERDEYKITSDINACKENIRILNLGFRVGATLMVDTNTSKKYRNHWQKATIVKINAKSVHYVIHWDREDGTTSTSDVRKTWMDFNYFRTIEEHARIIEEKKAGRRNY